MQLAQVEGFLEVARRANLSRAAEALFITQPALTARLRALEAEVGSPLFRRGRRGMALTDAGRAFLPYAERPLRALQDGASAIERLPADRRAGARRRARDLDLRPAAAAGALRGGASGRPPERPDRPFGGDPRDGRPRRRPGRAWRASCTTRASRRLGLYEDELVAGGRAGASACAQPAGDARAGPRRPADPVRPDVVVLRPDECAVPAPPGTLPRGVLELDHIDAAKQMVLAGLGVALLPTTAVASELRSGTLRRIELVGTPRIERRIAALRRLDDGRPARRPQAAFWSLLAGVRRGGGRGPAPGWPLQFAGDREPRGRARGRRVAMTAWPIGLRPVSGAPVIRPGGGQGPRPRRTGPRRARRARTSSTSAAAPARWRSRRSRRWPRHRVTGIDPSGGMLEVARAPADERLAERRRASIPSGGRLGGSPAVRGRHVRCRGLLVRAPARRDRPAALREIRRVLRPGGALRLGGMGAQTDRAYEPGSHRQRDPRRGGLRPARAGRPHRRPRVRRGSRSGDAARPAIRDVSCRERRAGPRVGRRRATSSSSPSSTRPACSPSSRPASGDELDATSCGTGSSGSTPSR